MVQPSRMANSKYEYVRSFERDEILLPNTWIVVRIDGRGFHKFSIRYAFQKPNDPRALSLMNHAAISVLRTLTPDVILAYGVSDEYSFVFHKSTTLFERRRDKLVSTVVSAFTGAYVAGWGRFMGGDGDGREGKGVELEEGWLPSFDGRAVCYPSMGNLRDYLSWRQVDCHINNLYNTTFHSLIQLGKLTPTAAEDLLKGTYAADKNEILFKRFGVNYNDEPEMYRKGSVVFREFVTVDVGKGDQQTSTDVHNEDQGNVPTSEADVVSKSQMQQMRKASQKAKIVVLHTDIIKDDFWERRPWILSGKPGRVLVESLNE